MKIGFDGKRALFNHTGLGNYSRFVINALATTYPDSRFMVYSPRSGEADDLLSGENVEVRLPRRKPLGSAWWRSVSGMAADAQADGCQVLHGLSGELAGDVSKRAVAGVVTIHDLIFCRYPELYKPISRRIYKYKALKACQRADRVIAVSECTKRDVVQFLGIAPDKIEVVYQGCASLFAQPITDDARRSVAARYHLPQRYLLNVGTIEERKNILLAVKALAQLATQDLELVIVGRRTPYTDMVEDYAARNRLSGRVHVLTGIPINDLPALYAGACAFVYPSRFEGFGIPIIEAQSCGTPVIAATGSCLEEAAGIDGAVMVSADSVDEMVAAIDSVTTDNQLRAQLVAAGKENIKRFAPERIAADLMAIYQKLT